MISRFLGLTGHWPFYWNISWRILIIFNLVPIILFKNMILIHCLELFIKKHFLFILGRTAKLFLTNITFHLIFAPFDAAHHISKKNLNSMLPLMRKYVEDSLCDIFKRVVGKNLASAWVLKHECCQIKGPAIVEKDAAVSTFCVRYPLISCFDHFMEETWLSFSNLYQQIKKTSEKYGSFQRFMAVGPARDAPNKQHQDPVHFGSFLGRFMIMKFCINRKFRRMINQQA